MSSFFRIFFASLLALVVFSILCFFLLLGIISSSTPKVTTGQNAVLVLDLSVPFPEVMVENPLGAITGDEDYDLPGVYDVVRLIEKAASDSAVKGILIRCGTNNNGFGSSEEIRSALERFKTSRKFVYAYADVISQGGYYVANVADKIYCNPKGGLDWRGYSMNYFFLKGTLQKLEIEPQIFYAGKFKSATEPFRETSMTEANRLQSSEILRDLYGHFLVQTSQSRGIDTATLHGYANLNSIQTPANAVNAGLVDGLKYEDDLREELKSKMKLSPSQKLNLVSLSKYAQAVAFKKFGKERIMVIYAQGDIIDGKGERDRIGSESYMNLIRKGRMDASIKAIVFRVNSGGGSALASENIWKELTLARQLKPVVVSFGDVAASGGYYISCNADSIFAEPNTITGSIGVFTILPNMQKFFNNKLGITFDGVKTSPDADALSVSKPLTESQRKWLQQGVDSIYSSFLARVAEGRGKTTAYIDSIGQGRIWSGAKAVELGLVDRIGGLQEAIQCAARMAKITDYRLREYPEPENIFDRILGTKKSSVNARAAIRQELGEEAFRTYETISRVKAMTAIPQARMPFELVIQ